MTQRRQSKRKRETGAGLVPLGAAAGYRLAPGEPDIRGWDVVTAAGARLGTVRELLIDPEASEVRALAVAVAGDDAKRSLAVLPVASVRLDEGRRAVVSDTVPASGVVAERPSRAAGGRGGARSAPEGVPAGTRPRSVDHPGVTVERAADGGEVIKVPIVEEELVVERRPVVREVVVIRKHPVQETRAVDAELRRERLEVDRRDAEGGR
jgi:hypothetical protein